MGRITRTMAALACCLLGAQHLHADDLVSIFELAQRNDPSLRQAQAQLRSGQQQVILSRSSLLPGVNAQASENRQAIDPDSGLSFPDQSTRRYAINASQSLLNMADWYTFQGARESDKARLANFAAEEQNLILRVAGAYFDVLRAIDDLQTRRQEEEAAERQFDRARQREEVGLVAITEVYEAQAAYDLARNNTILAEDLLASRYEELEAITGQPHPNLDVLRADFPIVPADGTVESWMEEAMENNLFLQIAEHNVAAQQQIVRARQADRWPTVSLSAGINRQETAAATGPDGSLRSPGEINATSLTLSVNVPLYTGGAITARRSQAEFDLVAQQEQRNLVLRQTRQDIRNSFRRVNTDSLVVQQRQQAITSAQSALDAVEAGYEVGTRNIIDVLLARQQLFNALRNYSEARYNYVMGTLFLKQAAGVLSPQDIIDLNQWLESEAATAQ